MSQIFAIFTRIVSASLSKVMTEDERIWAVKDLLFEYVRSPSLTHIRDPHSVIKLAQEIVRRLDRNSSIWKKWDGQRELALKSALGCWIPVDDMRAFLNETPGPALTRMDVVQRLRAFEDEDHAYPKEELKAGCLELYEREKAEGTEMAAIIGMLRDHLESEETRLYEEHQERYRRQREEDRQARELRLISGAECGWTQLQKSPDWHCRVNGRTFRLSPTTDRKWNLFEVASVEDASGSLIGKFQRRSDATKAVSEAVDRPNQTR